MDKPLVFVGLSGGVDSSVAALRLLRDGYRVVGVFIKVWQPDWLPCDWEQERLDAMRTAAHLGIPFLTCNAEEAYKTGVADYFIQEYTAGRTPNPDVMCNKHVKFGAFIDFAKENGADYIATGHYVQRTKAGDSYQLLRGIDSQKDQSYFLYQLTQQQLTQSLFPVGSSTKADIRAEAVRAGLPVANKKDSQGICFLGQVDIPEFIGHYTTLESGAVLDEAGKQIGEHRGALVYTLGQRHGFTILTAGELTQPHYVIARDIDNNTITVSTQRPTIDTESAIALTDCSWIDGAPQVEETVLAQTRYRQVPVPMRVVVVTERSATLKPLASIDSPSAGQSCVLYKANICLGGGIIA